MHFNDQCFQRLSSTSKKYKRRFFLCLALKETMHTLYILEVFHFTICTSSGPVYYIHVVQATKPTNEQRFGPSTHGVPIIDLPLQSCTNHHTSIFVNTDLYFKFSIFVFTAIFQFCITYSINE